MIGFLLLMAVGLGMDAFAVAIACGAIIREMRWRHVLRVAGLFGGFQAVMPWLGWLLGSGARSLLNGWESWVAAALLAGIGIKMIVESRWPEPEWRPDPLQWRILLLLGLATSLDALVAGMSLSLLGLGIVYPVFVIGAVTFGMAVAGMYLGDRYGHFFERRIEAVAGILLLALAVKTLLMH